MDVSVHMRPATLPRLLLVIIAFSSLLSSQAQAADVVLPLRWSELSPVIAGKQVRLTLKDRARLLGTARGVSASAIQLDVMSTSDRKAYPKGLFAAQRREIERIEVLKPKRHKGTIIGAIAGALFAATNSAGVMAGGGSESDLAPAIAAPLVLCTGVGWLLDHRHRVAMQITIMPD